MTDTSIPTPYLALASHLLKVKNDFAVALQFAGQALSNLEAMSYEPQLTHLCNRMHKYKIQQAYVISKVYLLIVKPYQQSSELMSISQIMTDNAMFF